jgi:hypothetical protein
MIRLPLLASLVILATPSAFAQNVDPSPRFIQAQATSFFGTRRVGGLGRTLARVWFEATVPTQEDRRLRAGYRFVAGCRAHDCPTKAAAIIAPGGAIVGAAMVALKCGETCEDTSTGFVFVRRTTPAWARDELRTWSRRVLAANASMEPSMGSTEEVSLDEAEGATR